nr:MBL fold metallo-hydrolase [uncultured Desulfuromonas sp.]
MLSSLLILAVGCLVAACIVLNQPKFGEAPQGDRLAAIQNSPHYSDGAFKNLIDTPKFTQEVSTLSILWNDLRNPPQRRVPEHPLPVMKTDLTTLDLTQDQVIWLGHSSFFIQIGGKTILLDPVFSASAAPLSSFNKAFAGTSLYTADDMPPIDLLLISHDHWDHLDYPTVTALKNKVAQVVCPLGVGAYFEKWGFPTEKIHDRDWNQDYAEDGLIIHVLPARHYSGRLLRQNQTLWAAFALGTSTKRLFFSGDSGYGPHFAEIGQRFGGFDFAAVECGQYDPRWANIHMTPEEAVKAVNDLKADAFLPCHIGRFSIARHAWDEPFFRVAAASRDEAFKLATPLIGEPVPLSDATQKNHPWWESTLSMSHQ